MTKSQSVKPYDDSALTHHTISVDGRLVSYWSSSDETKPPLVLVHGFRGNHKGLGSLAAVLSDHFQVFTPDLPGYGKSASLPANTIAGYGEAIAGFIAARKLDRPVLLGHSFGAAVTLYTAAHHASLIRQLILLCPVVPAGALTTGWTKFWVRLFTALPATHRRKLLQNRPLNILESLTMVRSLHPGMIRAVIDGRLTERLQNGEAVITENLISLWNTDTASLARKVTTPTAIIGGSIDTLAPTTTLRWLQRHLPEGASRTMIPTGGHLLPIEHPRRVAEVIRRLSIV